MGDIDIHATRRLSLVEDGDEWASFTEAKTAKQFCEEWLSALRKFIPETSSALLLLQDSAGKYSPAAVWPEGNNAAYFANLATECLRKREEFVERSTLGTTRLASPVSAGEHIYGVVALEFLKADETTLTRASTLIIWGAGWLIDILRRQEKDPQASRLAETGFLFDTVLAVLGEPDFHKAGLVLVNRLAQHFRCHQVQLGLEKGKTVRVAAVSHSAWFDERANLVNLAAQAMNEAFDQRVRILWPRPETGSMSTATAHQRYAKESGSAAICALPLEANQRVAGVLMLERDQPFEANELELLETAAHVLAPILNLKQAGDESLLSHTHRTSRKWLTRVTDSSHPAIKLGAGMAALLLLILSFWPTTYRVAAKAVVEGAVQRAAVAPFDGYIRSTSARAGDVVRAGQILASLEDKDLRLDQVRWEAELEIAQRKEREAMAGGDRASARLAAAQANEARAQLDLVLERLARVDVSAPFRAVVVKGDLSQQLGSPVEQGKVLFELAPLDAWRVIIKVDERDIAWVRNGQQGELVLSSLPGQTWPLTVKKVTPVSIAEEGRNYFRVEAALGKGAPKLRPNMEGVGKIEAGEKSLLWIWTHRLVDWLRMAWWEYVP